MGERHERETLFEVCTRLDRAGYESRALSQVPEPVLVQAAAP